MGYGKTAITIGLIDSSPDNKPDAGEGVLTPEQLRGRHAVKGTLIIVPTQLMNQWPKEIAKFTDDAMTVVVIKVCRIAFPLNHTKTFRELLRISS